MYISRAQCIISLALAVLSWAHPRPPVIINVDKVDVAPFDTEPRLDSSLASLEGLTQNRLDRSGRWKGPSEKYFHESTFNAHYDGRFASNELPTDERIRSLRCLIRTYLATMNRLGVETWIMHGTLLGWWWNRRIMPWDSDIDVQVSEPTLDFLSSYYNMSVHSFEDVEWLGDLDMGGRAVTLKRRDGVPAEKKKYMLEINPHWRDPSEDDKLNKIDARWIDTQSGLYIDITVVRRNTSHPVPGYMFCKDKHHYLARQIFPLRTSVFEGVPANIPYSYQELLTEEYGVDSLLNTVYEDEHHVFDQDRLEWRPYTEEDMVAIQSQDNAQAAGDSPSEEEEKEATKAAYDEVYEEEDGLPKSGQADEIYSQPGNANDK